MLHADVVGRAVLAGDEALARSCGRCVNEGVELRVRPVAGQPEGVGELCTRSAMVVEEYTDPDGWCALGDLATIDADERALNETLYDLYGLSPDERNLVENEPGHRNAALAGG